MDKNEPYYPKIIKLSKAPLNEEIGGNDFVVVIYKQKKYWALFICPCGCRNVISVSLQKIHKPHWRMKETNAGRPSLYPSIWLNKGCKSHFWITDGRIYWSKDTGEYPWEITNL